jgi:hypothetical protein
VVEYTRYILLFLIDIASLISDMSVGWQGRAICDFDQVEQDYHVQAVRISETGTRAPLQNMQPLRAPHGSSLYDACLARCCAPIPFRLMLFLLDV